MAHTNAWNETTPAGTDLISSGDNAIRQFKTDVRERMAADHVWNTSLDHDGKHQQVRLRPNADVTPITSEAPNTLSGSVAGGLINLSQVWNTSGVCNAVNVNVTDTASSAASSLLQLQVGGATKFQVSKAGHATAVGSLVTGAAGLVLTNPTTGKIPAVSTAYFDSVSGAGFTDIPESAIVDGTLLARVGASESVTGAWTMSNGNNAFTGLSFSGGTFSGTFSGNGAGITGVNAVTAGSVTGSVNAAQLTGVVPVAVLPAGTYYNLGIGIDAQFQSVDANLTGPPLAMLSNVMGGMPAGTQSGWIQVRDFLGRRLQIPFWFGA